MVVSFLLVNKRNIFYFTIRKALYCINQNLLIMINKYQILLLFILLISNNSLFSQETYPPNVISQGHFVKKTIPLRDFPTVNLEDSNTTRELTLIPNNLRANEKVNDNALPLGPDPLTQQEFGIHTTLGLIENFDGANASEGQATPPDPSGAVGPNHYVQGVNIVIKVYDKSGNVLAGPTNLGSFLGNGASNGDPIILYDHLADRFFVSQFQTSNDALIVGVSETSDPTGAYNVYEFPLDAFPDYPHYSIWPDGYYLTANKNSGNDTYVLERDVMIAGGANPNIVGFNLPGIVKNTNTVFSPEPANLTGTAFDVGTPGYIVYFQDDGWGGIANDHLKIWEIDMDWSNTNNSTVSSPLEVPIANFDSVFAPFGTGDVAQPGTSQKIDMIGGVISYAANYRDFGAHKSWLITFNVDIDGNDTSGIRWTELRTDGSSPWTVYQQGTYAPSDGLSRFMGSGAIDAAGNIGLAFNVASSTEPVGIRYTGRYDGDPLGTMTVTEEVIVNGIGVQTNTNRFGDYSHLTMDPDNFTFWHTAEYFTANNSWATRIAAFNLSNGFNNDIGVSSINTPSNGTLSATETVEVNVRNYGLVAQSNFPIELRLDGNLVATETFTGTIQPNEVLPFTFAQTVDLSIQGNTYTIAAKTNLTGDELVTNDEAVKAVTHLLNNDVGVVAITSPNTGQGLGLEDVTITIENFGVASQSNFDVQYILDANPPVIETYTGTLASGQTATFTFATQADITALGDYTFVAKTNLATDQDTSNDPFSKTITHSCFPTATTGCTLDGIKRFVLNTIDIDDGGNGCNTEPASSPPGYADRTHLSTILSNVNGANTYTLQARQNWTGGAGVEALSVWIDFNDNLTFEPSEQLIQGEFFQSNNVLEDFTLTIPTTANLGSHVLRAKAIDTSAAGDINNPCSDYAYGETQDYTVIIDNGLSVEDQLINDSVLNIYTLDQNIFDVHLTTNLESNVYLSIYNVQGQQLAFKLMAREGKDFKMKLDLSRMSSGMYFIKVGSQQSNMFKTKKIIVR